MLKKPAKGPSWSHFKLLGQVEHDRPVPADLPVQQRLPQVAVVGGELLDLFVKALVVQAGAWPR
ncbi:hypothetical protein [Streptomyces sp. NPDC016172]|uniref:hypothetical protein n=1 Tax=Streptomyces sp. NPDC016172 TaxID=3364964 RepID=UPI00370153E8